MKEGFSKWENSRRNITCYNCDKIGYYINEYIQLSNKPKYNSDFYYTNYNKQRHTRKFCTRRQ